MTTIASTPAPGDWDYRPFAPISLDRFGNELSHASYVPPLRSKNTYFKMRQRWRSPRNSPGRLARRLT